MSTWQAAWRLAVFEIRTGWPGLLITLIFFAYAAVVGTPLLDALLTGEIPGSYGWICDYLYLTVLPNMGFLLNPPALRYWRTDVYTKKLAAWRALPISDAQIASGRLLQLVVNMVPVWLFFFALEYMLVYREAGFAAGAYLNYALFWLGYSVLFAVMYVCLEQSLPGRIYFVACLCYMPVYALLTLLLQLSDVTVIVEMADAAKQGNWLPTGLMLALAAAAVWAGKAAVQRLIGRRNILG